MAGLLLAGLLATACPAAPAAPRELRFGWKTGLELRYRLTMEGLTRVTLGELSDSRRLATTLYLTQRVLAIAKDGAARILTRVESGRTKTADGPSQIMPPRQGTMRMDDRGNLLDGSLLESGAAPLQLVFPTRPLALGDSWFNSLPPSEEIPVPIRVRYTLVGRKEEVGYRCLEIAVQIESARASALESELQLRFQGTGTMLFAPEEGLLVSSRIASDLTLEWEQHGPGPARPAKTETSFDIRLDIRR